MQRDNFVCFYIVPSLTFVYFICEAICVTLLMGQTAIYEKNQFQDYNAVYCCHLMFVALHLYNYSNWLHRAFILVCM